MANKKMVMAVAGKNSFQGYKVIPPTASPTKDPHEAKGAWTPSPRKERKDSVIMNDGILNVEKTIMTLSELGIKWRNIIRHVGAPIDRAASMNSWFFSDMICPRTMRLMVSQLIIARARKRFKIFLPKIAIAIITSNM